MKRSKHTRDWAELRQMAHIVIKLDPSIGKRIKMRCVDEGVTMRAWITALALEALGRPPRTRGLSDSGPATHTDPQPDSEPPAKAPRPRRSRKTAP